MGHKRGVDKYLTTKIWDMWHKDGSTSNIRLPYYNDQQKPLAWGSYLKKNTTQKKTHTHLPNTYLTNQLQYKKKHNKNHSQWVVIKINNPNRLLFQTYLNHGPSLNRLCSPRNFCKISRPKAHWTTSRAQLHTLNVKSSWLCQGSSWWLFVESDLVDSNRGKVCGFP